MKVTEHIQKSDSTIFSIEILPPSKGEQFSSIKDAITPLLPFNPAFVNITHHQEKFVYKTLSDGTRVRRIIQKNPSTFAVAAAVKIHYNVNVVPHIICAGMSKEMIQNALINFHYVGINNVFALRGDTERNRKMFLPEKEEHEHAIDLVKQIQNMNHGIFLDQDMEKTWRTDFCIGVAGYPEKHGEAPNAQTDLMYLKQKVDAGASYIVTQMFFNNKKYYDFVNQCRNVGITVPIIAGLKPISLLKHRTVLPEIFNIQIPKELSQEMGKCKNNEAIRQLGIEWAVMQSKDLIHNKVPGLHYYTMGRTTNIAMIADKVF